MPSQAEELKHLDPWLQIPAQAGATPAVLPDSKQPSIAALDPQFASRTAETQVATTAALGHWGEESAKASCATAARETVPIPPLRDTRDVARKPAPAKAAEPSFLVDGQGRIFTAGACHVQIGFRDGAGRTFVGLDSAGKQHGFPIALARLGTLKIGGETQSLLRMEQVTQKVVPAAGADSSAAAHSQAKPESGVTASERAPAPTAVPAQEAGSKAAGSAALGAAELTPCQLTWTGQQSGLLESGEQILDASGKGLSPLPPGKLPATVLDKLDAQSRIELASGQLWVYMNFALSDEKTPTGRWVPPGHDREQVASDQRLVRTEADRLPAESRVRTEVESVLRIIGLICSVEGRFDAVSPPGDIYASLGIFQWAMPKDASGETGSMGVFFSKLKERAQAASARPEQARTEEDKLYVAAWEQCTQHGLELQGQKLQLNGAAATGRSVEDELHAEMSKGALRTYQLIAARDWIEVFRNTVVRPGPSASGWIKNGYLEQNARGTKVKLRQGTSSFILEASAHATVGELLSSEQALAYAVMLGVNRPHYVEGALWKAACSESEPGCRCTELLTRLDALLTAQADGANKKPAARTFTAADIEAAGDEAKAVYAQLQALIWPTGGTLSAEALASLPAGFKASAMQLYAPGDARAFHRERRFSTVDAAW